MLAVPTPGHFNMRLKSRESDHFQWSLVDTLCCVGFLLFITVTKTPQTLLHANLLLELYHICFTLIVQLLVILFANVSQISHWLYCIKLKGAPNSILKDALSYTIVLRDVLLLIPILLSSQQRANLPTR